MSFSRVPFLGLVSREHFWRFLHFDTKAYMNLGKSCFCMVVVYKEVTPNRGALQINNCYRTCSLTLRILATHMVSLGIVDCSQVVVWFELTSYTSKPAPPWRNEPCFETASIYSEMGSDGPDFKHPKHLDKFP